jgi:hypothetical protein
MDMATKLRIQASDSASFKKVMWLTDGRCAGEDSPGRSSSAPGEGKVRG